MEALLSFLGGAIIGGIVLIVVIGAFILMHNA
jgi:hypothetical protein